ncbi:hypothetical protein JM18_002330 [Phytophthora kernoviae]|uniref:6-phosphogluconolactonase n=1 Tax=Phytophthora kernoviae TaxID=325452 RepID=A0A8T0M1W1_9STRA|nr:hypothetical protein JM16_003223 [Phytophthora kernoviae]KAG2527750.1 hypothetical protein JM18_002330 [Phytophthora kernoviae]
MRLLNLLCCFMAAVTGAAAGPPTQLGVGSSKQPILFASANSTAHFNLSGEGVYSYKFDTTDGSLTPLDIAPIPTKYVHGSTRSFSHGKRAIYAVNAITSNSETLPGTQTGRVYAFSVNSNGTLELLNSLESLGTSPAHISLSPEEDFLLVTNYGGSLTMFPLNDDGSLGKETFHQVFPNGSNVVMPQQSTGHIHSSTWLPNSNHVVVADLGSDELLQYNFDVSKKTLESLETVSRPPGSGPRHMVVHPNSKFAYIIDELSNVVGVYKINEDEALLAAPAIQNITTLPANFSGTSTGADIHLSSNARFLYTSNRGHDSIAIFAINEEDGTLTSLGWESSRGQVPRGFIIYEDWLILANQKSGDMKVFKVNADTGKLSGVWAIMYAWYFPKDAPANLPGRRHEWENCVVWIDNPALENPKILGISVSGGNARYYSDAPPDERGLSGDTPKIDYLMGSWPSGLLLCLVATVAGAAANSMATDQIATQPILFGAGASIYTYKLDTTDGSLAPFGTTALGSKFVRGTTKTFSEGNRVIYAINSANNDSKNFPGTQTGNIYAYTLNSDGSLKLLNTLETHGASPAHISLSPDEDFVVVSNYGGSLSMFPLNADGSLADETFHQEFPTGSKIVSPQQDVGRIHSTTWLPNSNHVVAANLGSDELLQYNLDASEQTLKSLKTVNSPPGSGPRHMALHPNNKFAYITDEISNTVNVFRIDQKAALLTGPVVQKITTIPADFTNTSTAADVHFSSNGKFLYASNRGHDSIAIFKIDETDGTLTSVGWESSRGKTPRGFIIYEDWLIVANQGSGDMYVFKVDADTGKLAYTGNSYEASKVLCLYVSA